MHYMKKEYPDLSFQGVIKIIDFLEYLEFHMKYNDEIRIIKIANENQNFTILEMK